MYTLRSHFHRAVYSIPQQRTDFCLFPMFPPRWMMPIRGVRKPSPTGTEAGAGGDDVVRATGQGTR